MKKYVLHILFIACTSIYSQSNRSLSFESGAVISKPFTEQEHLTSDGGTFYYDWNYTYYTAVGHYSKVSFDLRSKPKNNWGFTFPISLSYLTQITSIYAKGWYSGCLSYGEEDAKKTYNNNNIISSFGMGVQYQDFKTRQSINLSVNNTFTFRSTITTDQFNDGTSSKTQNDNESFTMYFGGQYYALYNLKKNIWLGPSCEVYYYRVGAFISDVSQKIRPSEYRYKSSGPNTGLNGNYIWINPGIKLQIDID
jgi:hypothetical protein